MPLEAHAEEYEELPQYEPPSLPQYEYQPSAVFSLRQIDRKVQLLVPTDSTSKASYKIVHRTVPSLFTSKADMTLSVFGGDPVQEESVVATMNFARDGPLPWTPRAEIWYNAPTDARGARYSLEAENFTDWKITIGGSPWLWSLDDRPTSLLLVNLSSLFIVARFTYSVHGTLATKGLEVGELAIYEEVEAVNGGCVELVIASCAVAIAHWKRMGKNYRKNTKIRTNTETTAVRPVGVVPPLAYM